MNDHIAIPSRTLVQGEVRRVQHPGRVKGRAELLMNFTSMIFPNGYTIRLPGVVQARLETPERTVSRTGKGRLQEIAARKRMWAPLSAQRFRELALEPSPTKGVVKVQPSARPVGALSAWLPFC
jgi:hypothetical protein